MSAEELNKRIENFNIEGRLQELGSIALGEV